MVLGWVGLGGPESPSSKDDENITLSSRLSATQQMATSAKFLSPHPHTRHPHYHSSTFTATQFHNHQPLWPRQSPRQRNNLLARAIFLPQHLASSSSALVDQLQHYTPAQDPLFLVAAETAGYSLASYYTSLGLFVISVPGLWSLIKRSVKSKIVQKTFVEEGAQKNAPNQVAGEILSFFTRNNFAVTDRGETITFEGIMVPSRGQAALLTFCTCISLASVALVLTITFPDFGNNWFWITILSPLAGVYYWQLASRKEQIKVKMMVADDGTLTEVIVQGDDQQVEQLRKELKFSEKGMVYVKGIFER